MQYLPPNNSSNYFAVLSIVIVWFGNVHIMADGDVIR